VLAFVIRVEECFSLYIMLSMILQLYALGTLIVGIGVAVSASNPVDPSHDKGSTSGVSDVAVKSPQQSEGN
jgi:hypothetical protein